MKKLLAFFLMAAAAALPGRTQAGEPLRIGILPIVDALPFILMEEEKRPDDIVIVSFNSALERDAALEVGQIDGCVTDPLATAMMLSQGMDVVMASLILGANPAEGRFAILSSPSSDIRSAADLARVPIGVSSSTIIDYVTDSLLLAAGLQPAQVIKEEVKKIPVRMQMLLSDQIRAATLPDPLAFFAQTRGAHLVIDDTKGANISQTVLLLSGRAITDKGDSIRRMFAVYDELVDKINAAPDDYRQVLVEKARLPEPISRSYPVDHFPRAGLPDRASIEAVVTWAEGKGLLAKSVNYDGLTGRSPLK